MRYQKYQQRVLKWLKFLSALKLKMGLIIALFLTTTALFSLGVAVKGVVYYTSGLSEVEYGTALNFRANAFFAPLELQYASHDSEDWSAVAPIRVGSYKVRAVSSRAFGKTYYSKPHNYDIVPKRVEIEVKNDTILYGQNPEIAANLAYNDKITDFLLEYGQNTITLIPHTIAVVDQNNINVADCYEFSTKYKTISVNKLQITVKFASGSAIYDGSAHKFEGFELAEGSLNQGDSILAVFDIKITEVGQAHNAASLKILNSLGGEVTHLYDIKTVLGTLTMQARPLLISLTDSQKTYDGTPLSSVDFSISEGTLVEGHEISVKSYTELTDAGQADNIVAFNISQNGQDFTQNYAIAITKNTLTVNKRQITLKSDSATKVYDGTPLTSPSYDIEGELVDTHTLSVDFWGSQTLFGTSPNQFKAQILDNLVDKSTNYDIDYQFGELNVTKRNLKISTASAQFVYNGQIQTDTTMTITEGTLPQDQTIKAQLDLTQSGVGQHQNRLTASVFWGDTDISQCYEIEYTYGTITITPFAIEITTATAALPFSGQTQSNPAHTISPALFSGHKSVVNLGAATVLNVGDSQLNQFTVSIMEGDTDITQNYNISYVFGTLTVTPLSTTVTTNSATFEYDGTMHSEGGFTISDIVDGHTAIIDGVPPSFMLVKRNSDLSVGYYDNAFSVKIVDRFNLDVSYNYDIDYIFGKIIIALRAIAIKTHSNEWVYDGQPHSQASYDLVGELVAGHYIVPNPVSIRTVNNVMRNQNTVIDTDNSLSIFIKNAEGSFVDFNYDITYTYGKLKILPRPITVRTATREWEYDADDHYDYTTSIVLGELVSGHSLKVVTAAFFSEVVRQNGLVCAVQNDTEVAIFSNNLGNYEDMSLNYDISYDYGTVTITPRAIEITTATASFVYDGLTHSDTNCTVTVGTLAKDYHTLRLNSIFPTKTNVIRLSDGSVGGIDNRFDIYISDDINNYADISYNYDITMVYGELKILPREITVSPTYASKPYDGTPLFSDAVTVVIGELVEGHILTAICSGSQTEIGQSPNDIISAFIYLDEQDLTYNYDINYFTNLLLVQMRLLHIHAHSAYKTYDGLPLTDSGFYTIGDGLLYGHTVYATVYGEQTAIGSSENTISPQSVAILDELGNDVSQYYNIFLFEGTLWVGLSVLTISTQSASKPYDGTPLTAPNYTVEGVLLEGDRLEVNVFGTITEVGAVQNGANISVYNAWGTDITEDYVIVTNFGTLAITSPDQPQDGGKLDGSGKINADGFKPAEGDAVTFKATATTTGTTFFRYKSFGDYLRTDWGAATPYLSGSANALTLSSSAVAPHSVQSSVTIEHMSASFDYLLPYFATNGFSGIKDDTVVNLNSAQTYTIAYNFYEFNEGDNLSVKTNLSEFERNYAEFVKNNYLQLPSDTKAAMLKVIKDNNLDPNSPTIISEVINLVQNYVKYSFDFKYEGDIAVYFFTKASTGICQHYATAATALLRALGIPARYTIGYAAQMTAYTTVSVTPNQAHAWVEVYIDGAGFVPIEVTGAGEGNAADGGIGDGSGGGGGGGTITQKLTIKPVDVSKQFDGTTLFAKNEVEGADFDSVLTLEYLTENNYTFDIEVIGQRLAVGVDQSTIYKFLIYDRYNKNVTNDFEISYKVGRVRIVAQAIEIVVFSLKKNYDGTPLSYNHDDYYLNKPLNTGYTLDFELSGSLTNAGVLDFSELEKLPFTVKNDLGNDVSQNYELIFMGEPLRVDKRIVEFTSASQTKAYDGTPLINKSVWLSKGALPQNYSFEAIVLGSITDIGTMQNKIDSVTIYNSLGMDTSQNFHIILKSGVLKID